MTPTTAGRFRVLPGPDDDRWLFLSLADPADPDGTTDGYDPIYVPQGGHDDLDGAVANLHPGHLVEAIVTWDGETPRIEDLSVLRPTLFEFVDEVTGLFEAARTTWAEAMAANDPMNSRVTYGTDGEPNGVLYVFAQQTGAQDLFEEFRSGLRPLDPLIERIDTAQVETGEEGDTAGESGAVSIGPGGNIVVDNDDRDDETTAREVFVMRPATDPCVVVYIVLEQDSLLADTIRDTYHCPRPSTDG